MEHGTQPAHAAARARAERFDDAPDDDYEGSEDSLAAAALAAVGAGAGAAPDGGEALRQVLRDELGVFRAFVASVFDTQQRDIARLLLKEEGQLRQRYEQWTRMVNNRSQRVKRFLADLMPNFNWDEYKRARASAASTAAQPSTLAPDGDFSAWRQESFLKLLFLEDEAAKLREENSGLSRAVAAQRRRRLEAKDAHAQSARTAAQNNRRLEHRLRALRHERGRLTVAINDLFAAYERGATSAGPTDATTSPIAHQMAQGRLLR